MDEYLQGFNEWLALNVSDKTRRDYIYWCNRMLKEGGELTKKGVMLYYDKSCLERGQDGPIMPLKAALQSLCLFNDWKVKFPKTKKKKGFRQPKYYEEDTALTLIEKMPRRYRLIAKLMYETGIRVSEATNLRIEDIKKSESRILILGKGDRERSAYPGDELISALISHYDSYIPSRKFGYIFSSPKKFGKPITTKTVRHHLRKCGVEGAKPHKFRHTYAINLLKEGENLPTIQKSLGHININTTSIYTSVFDADVKQASERHRARRNRNEKTQNTMETSNDTGKEETK